MLCITLPAAALAALLLAAAIEVWVRVTWDPRQGAPGLFVSDPVRGQRLSPNYRGWFAGVPIAINNLGLRDERDQTLDKAPGTYRILVLGDSVTFGHGSVHAYPALLEDLLKAWRPEVNWQVWNAAVPGYNTSQELAQLLEVGPAWQPDLVIVGFFENDLIGNRALEPPSFGARVRSRLLAFAQRHVYSFELYKRVALSLAWRWSGSTSLKQRLEHLETESALLAGAEPLDERSEQRLTDYERLPDEAVGARPCIGGETPDAAMLAEMQRDAEWEAWVRAVRGFQALHAEGAYRVVFFLNTVPPVCADGDFFYEGGSRAVEELYLSVMRDPTPAVSAFDAFLRRRPSEMPAARAHAVGNSNLTKAEVLFEFLRDRIFPPAGPEAAFSAADPTR